MKRKLLSMVIAAGLGAAPLAGLGQDAGHGAPADPAKFYKKPGYSPYAGRVFPERPLWGDQHVHTGWSVDAGIAGTTLTPEDAVRFARGAEITSTSGQPVRLRARSTGSWSPIIPTRWARSPSSAPATRSSWPTRRSGAGAR